MRGEGRGKHPAAAIRIAIGAIEEWAQRIPYHEIPTLPRLEILKISIANEVIRELTRRGAPTTKEIMSDFDFRPSAIFTERPESEILKMIRDNARAENIRWMIGNLERSSCIDPNPGGKT
jgi:hypothetical protein